MGEFSALLGIRTIVVDTSQATLAGVVEQVTEWVLDRVNSSLRSIPGRPIPDASGADLDR